MESVLLALAVPVGTVALLFLADWFGPSPAGCAIQRDRFFLIIIVVLSCVVLIPDDYIGLLVGTAAALIIGLAADHVALRKADS